MILERQQNNKEIATTCAKPKIENQNTFGCTRKRIMFTKKNYFDEWINYLR